MRFGEADQFLELFRGRVVGDVGELRVLRSDRDREKIDEVTVHHQAPGKPTLAAAGVMAEEGDELALHDVDVEARRFSRDRAQVLPEVKIADDERIESARTRHSGDGGGV